MSATAAVIPTNTTPVQAIRILDLDKIHPSSTNPRTHIDLTQLAELAADIKERGVIQPILVRTVPKGWEILVGERRWRASKNAGLSTIPAIVRDDMGPAQILEAQLVENLQRAQLGPMEEAEHLARLQKDCGYKVPDLMARVSKSASYVYSRLALLMLPATAKKALADGRITDGVAVLIARLPHVKTREDAAKDVLRNGDSRGPMTYREAVEHIQDRYHLDLKKAPFSTSAADLIPDVGPCTTCPKRTGNNRTLFGDIKDAEQCTDAACFGAKRDAAWKQNVASAKEKGLAVLSDQDAVKALSHGQVRYDSPFLDVEEDCHIDPKRRSWQKLLGKHLPQVKLARDPHTFEVFRLITKEAAAAALAVAAPEVVKQQKVNAPTVTPAQKKARAQEREKAARAKLVAVAVRREVLKKAGEKVGLDAWKFLGRVLIDEAWTESSKEIALARGSSATSDCRAVLKTLLGKMTEPEARGFAFEILLAQQSRQRGSAFDIVLRDAARAFGVDVRKVAALAVKKAAEDKAGKGNAPARK